MNVMSSRNERLEKWIVEKYEKEKEERIKQLRREASRLVSMANKRLIRLEANKLTDVPAYQQLVDIMGTNKPRFSIRGKDYNELQREISRMRRFLDAKTSTVRGANQVLKEMAKNTGIKYKSMKELREKAKLFFELASKVEQYLRTVHDIASAIGYQKIWQAVNTYVKDAKRDIDTSKIDLERAVFEISEAIREYEEKEFVVGNYDNQIAGWFRLADDEE